MERKREERETLKQHPYPDPPSKIFQIHHHLQNHHHFRLPLIENKLQHAISNQDETFNTPSHSRRIIANVHMSKARRSKSETIPRSAAESRHRTNRNDSVQIWRMKSASVQIWKSTGRSTIGEPSAASETYEYAQRMENLYKSGKFQHKLSIFRPHFLILPSSTYILLLSSKSSLLVMDNQKKTYKQALFTNETNPENMTKQNDNETSPNAEKAGEVPLEKMEQSAEKAFQWMDKTITSNVSGLESFLQKLAKVEENIINLQKTTLFATFWKGAAESNRLKAKLRTEWQHIKGEFELIDRANNWYEVKFSNPIDRQNIWDHRPYYAFGNLLVLTPWKTNFDPLTMKLKTIDVWVRILFLPSEYITPEIVAAIIEHNDIGKFIRLDPFTENRTRTKYARVCVAINCTDKPKNFVVIPNANGEYKIYKLWFEGVSEGCANCGAEDHQFEFCPLRMSRKMMKEGRKDRNLVQDNASDVHFSEESSVDKGKQKMEWNETMQEWPQGIEQMQQMHAENFQQPEPIFDQQTLAQNQENRGTENEMFVMKKAEELDAESFKTGVAATTLTHDMGAIQVTEGKMQNKKKKRDSRLEPASSSSKRTKTSSK